MLTRTRPQHEELLSSEEIIEWDSANGRRKMLDGAKAADGTLDRHCAIDEFRQARCVAADPNWLLAVALEQAERVQETT